jgi:hypothetical protein
VLDTIDEWYRIQIRHSRYAWNGDHHPYSIPFGFTLCRPMQIADCDGFNTPRGGFCAPVCEAIYHANVTKDMQNAKFLFDFWFYLAQKKPRTWRGPTNY